MAESPKRNVRTAFRAILASTPPSDFQRWNASLVSQLASVASLFSPNALVAAYRPRAEEANPAPLYRLPFRFCFPRVLPGEQLEFRFVGNPGDESQFRAGYKGIREPRETSPLVRKEDILVCLVPLLAFDEAGGRLGHGKGYYDRFLSGFSGLKVGLGFECQRAAALPLEPHDHKLDLMVTEARIRDFRP